MRTRTRQPEVPKYVKQFDAYEGRTMIDDPDPSLRGLNKKCQWSEIKILNDEPQGLSYDWYDPWQDKWFGPVVVSSGHMSSEGPIGFYGVESCGTNPATPQNPPGFIWDEIQKYGKSDISIGVFLGELRETIQMFHNPWRVAVMLAKEPKIPKWVKTIPDAFRFLQNSYLEWRYGWRPFLSDMRNVTRFSKRMRQKLMNNDIDGTSRTLRAFRTNTATSTKIGSYEWAQEPQSMLSWNNCRTVETTSCEYCTVQSNPSAAALSIANQFASFYHLSDLASIAWELTPCSFIVDRFLPIGDAIASVFDQPANVVAASSPWRWERVTNRCVVSNTGRSNSTYRVSAKLNYVAESTSFIRDTLGAFPPKPSEIDGWFKLDLALIAGQRLGPFFGKSFRR